MSFATQAKQDLCQMNVKKDCCRRSLLYGILLFAVNFDENRIRLITESDDTASLTLKLLRELYGIEGNLYVTYKKQLSENAESQKSNKITVSVKADVMKIMSKFGYITDDKAYGINTELFSCENCRTAFLRGAFLSSGLITNPERSYHLEIPVRSKELAHELVEMLKQSEISARHGTRHSQDMVYIKSSEQIENFLAYIGASNALFEMMNSRILKEAKNDANRLRNCDTANLLKTVSASTQQIEAIKKLLDNNKLGLLPSELRETALKRLEFPELSIKEFGLVFDPPISKSGINHRLRKIMEFADNN